MYLPRSYEYAFKS
uniref:Uncharacterized protein n=1 Tax=Arundo donax TaxID=35708 RepID=A0A0A9CKM0_ARUDO